jgi:hypothetical protein
MMMRGIQNKEDDEVGVDIDIGSECCCCVPPVQVAEDEDVKDTTTDGLDEKSFSFLFSLYSLSLSLYPFLLGDGVEESIARR